MRRRLMDQPSVEAEVKRLTRMLVTLGQMNIVVLDPPPPEAWKNAVKPAAPSIPVVAEAIADEADAGPAAPESKSDSVPAAIVATPRAKPPTVSELLARLKLGEHVGTTA